jgi:hypothetical protein
MHDDASLHRAVELNGDEPALLGLVCQDLLAVEYVSAGAVVEDAHSVYLRFAGRWHRLYFDFGTVFWRVSDKAPVSFVAEDLGAEYRVVDLAGARGLRGLRLCAIRYTPIEDGSEVALEFESGRVLAFSCVADITSVLSRTELEVTDDADTPP